MMEGDLLDEGPVAEADLVVVSTCIEKRLGEIGNSKRTSTARWGNATSGSESLNLG